MSHIPIGGRAYVPFKDEFGFNRRRNFLGLQSATAVVQTDDGQLWGFAGHEANTDLVVPETKENGLGEVVETMPTDFRIAGIQVLTSLGVPEETQIQMFTNFMVRFTKAERAGYVAQYDAIKDSPEGIAQFASAMAAMLL